MERICIIASDFRADYNDDFVTGAEKEANRLGYVTEVFSMPQRSELFTNGEDVIYKFIDFNRYAGVIYVERSFSRHRGVENILTSRLAGECKKPLVAIGSTRDSNIEDAIFDDCSGMIESLTDHLIEVHDCKTIYFLGGEKGARNGRRIDGYITSMEKHGLNVYDEHLLYGGFWIECAEKLAKNISYGKIDKPDAVMCINDTIAYALIKALYRYGLRVPEDIIVTGFDGGTSAFNKIIPITTIEADSEYVGRKAMSSLYEKMTGKKPPEVRPKLRSISTGISCGCGLKKSSDIRIKLDIQDKHDREEMELRNSQLETRMFSAKNVKEMVDVLKNSRYLIPDCKCLGVSLIDEQMNAECIFLTQAIEGEKTVKYKGTDIFPEGFNPVDTWNVHVVPLVFAEKLKGIITIGYDEPYVYGGQGKEFIRILSNAIEILELRSNINYENVITERSYVTENVQEADNVQENKNVIMALKDGYMCRVLIDNIIYVEAGERKVYIVTKNDRYELKKKMFEIEKQLEDKGFMRISKSCIANLKKIVSFKQEEDRTLTAITTGKETLRISRGKVEEFKSRM